MEIVGFLLQGPQVWQRLKIEDLDVIATPANRRLLPLLRLLKALHIEKTEQADVISFQAEGGPKTILNLRARRLRVDDTEGPVDFVMAMSDVTLQRDIYLPAEVVAEILAVKLEWNEAGYEFKAQVNRRLKIWPREEVSLSEIQADDEEARLPEVLPAAYPPANSLDFMELQMFAWVAALEEDRDAGTRKRRFQKGAIEGLRQTFWGSLMGGRYKVRIGEPQLYFEQSDLQKTNDSRLMVEWAEWTYRMPTAEIALGDMSFGLSDLVFPTVTMTGLRFNGFVGGDVPGAGRDETSPGLRNFFVQSYDFEGYAKAGSRAQLVINDRVVSTETIIADSPTQPGLGAYRFEDVRLSPSVLNDVRIVVTDPDGLVTQIRKRILPATMLLPRGRLAYLGGIGTNRDISRWTTFGTLGGGRVLYGVTDRLTIGLAAASQDAFFEPQIQDATLLMDEPPFPHSSTHLGGQFAWQPAEVLLLSGSAAASSQNSRGRDAQDSAWNVKADLYPHRDVTAGAQLFRYGPDFFNGQNILLRDRFGHAVWARWTPHPQWHVAAMEGRVRNNLGEDLPETLTVDFQHFEVGSSALPRTTATFALDRTRPSSTHRNQNLYTVRSRTQLPGDVTLYLDASVGRALEVEAEPNLFSGLALPMLAVYQAPAGSATLMKLLTRQQTVGAQFRQSGQQQRATAVHTFRSSGERPVQVRTEVGMDLFRRDSAETEGKRNVFFENRAECLLDAVGRNRFGVLSHLQRDEWTVMAYVNISTRFAFDGGPPRPITDLRVEPDRGAVRGRVFIDYNANARPDPGEPGLQDVKVVIGRTHTATTDASGCFLLPGMRASAEVRVALDIDTIPAMYWPTSGKQVVVVLPGNLTTVDLGVAPVVSAAGSVQAAEPEGKTRPVAGVRVFLTEEEKDVLVAESYTARDGSYSLDNLHAGRYVLRVDLMTLPKGAALDDTVRSVVIPPEKEPQDVRLAPFVMTAPPPVSTEKSNGNGRPGANGRPNGNGGNAARRM
ncbi:MAG: hypothetical protein FJ288_03300 [Planctomycetes bacterium]|nr:hypothetical protein [Planctomycetota bacterium]